jgi:uncharacterized protein YjgD (DUF1641 family)
MAEPIDTIPETAVAGRRPAERHTDENLTAILDALEEAGVLTFLRALMEQRAPIARRLITRLDTPPTKRGVKNLLTGVMALGALPEDSGARIGAAVVRGLETGRQAAEAPRADRLSLWTLVRLMRDPEIARAVHYLAGFLKGIGIALKTRE